MSLKFILVIATWEGNNENPYNKGKYISKSSLKIPIVTNAIKIKDKTKMLYVNESPKIVNIPLSNKIKLTPKGIKALTNVTPIMKKENRLFQSVIISDPFERNYIKHNSDHNSNRILSENMKDKISNWSMKYKPKEPKKIVITGKDRKHSYQKIANLNEKEIRIIPNDDSSADNSFSKLNSSINSVNLPKQSKEFLSYSQPTQAVKEIKKDNIEVSKFDPIADMRKFSILDVPGCALIKPDAIQSGDSSIHNSKEIR